MEIFAHVVPAPGTPPLIPHQPSNFLSDFRIQQAPSGSSTASGKPASRPRAVALPLPAHLSSYPLSFSRMTPACCNQQAPSFDTGILRCSFCVTRSALHSVFDTWRSLSKYSVKTTTLNKSKKTIIFLLKSALLCWEQMTKTQKYLYTTNGISDALSKFKQTKGTQCTAQINGSNQYFWTLC